VSWFISLTENTHLSSSNAETDDNTLHALSLFRATLLGVCASSPLGGAPLSFYYKNTPKQQQQQQQQLKSLDGYIITPK
jgi:hypothetical protein